MFREMRRYKQCLSNDEIAEILARNTAGTLALLGDDGYPYSVPLSYVYAGNRIFFHSAKEGHKIDAINAYSKASFSVIDKDTVVPEKYTTYFRSVIAFGTVHIVEAPDQKYAAMNLLGQKYRPGFVEQLKEELDGKLSALVVIEFTIDHITGKEAVEFVRMRQS